MCLFHFTLTAGVSPLLHTTWSVSSTSHCLACLRHFTLLLLYLTLLSVSLPGLVYSVSPLLHAAWVSLQYVSSTSHCLVWFTMCLLYFTLPDLAYSVSHLLHTARVSLQYVSSTSHCLVWFTVCLLYFTLPDLVYSMSALLHTGWASLQCVSPLFHIAWYGLQCVFFTIVWSCLQCVSSYTSHSQEMVNWSQNVWLACFFIVAWKTGAGVICLANFFVLVLLLFSARLLPRKPDTGMLFRKSVNIIYTSEQIRQQL